MMVIFLVGLVSMILMRTLRKDYARYSKEEEMDDMVGSRELLDSGVLGFCIISFCLHRTETWGTNMGGSRFTEMSSGRPAIL